MSTKNKKFIDNPNQAIGKRIRKISGKPFKSRQKVNTVKAVVPHPVLEGKMAFSFSDEDRDSSLVECGICIFAD